VFSPNTLPIKSSKLLLALLLFFTAVVFYGLYLIDLPRQYFAWSALLAGVYGAYTIAQHALLMCSSSISAVFASLDSHGSLRLTIRTRKGVWHKAELQADTLVTPWLSVLVVKADAKSWWTRKIILTRDNCDPDLFRKLRVLIRFSSNINPTTQTLAS